MTWRSAALAWLLALALLAAGAAALAARGREPVFGGAPVAVIGSSQSFYAFAKRGNDLAPDGNGHTRVGLPAISEAEVLGLVDTAIRERARLVLVEAWPLVADLPPLAWRGRCDQPARDLRLALRREQLRLTDPAARLLGRATSTDDGGEPGDLAARDPAHFAATARGYDLIHRPPCDTARLAAQVRRAQTQGTRVVLVALPRSATAERLLGPAKTATLDGAVRDLARRTGADLFVPSPALPDDRFVSIGHVDAVGRARLAAELRAWLAQHQ